MTHSEKEQTPLVLCEHGAVEPHYSLDEAASRFFPGGKITRRSLRTEIEKGFLPRKKIAGKLVTCASDVARMLELKQCHEDRKAPAFTSSQRTAPVVQFGSSKTERSASARAAALMKLEERAKRLGAI